MNVTEKTAVLVSGFCVFFFDLRENLLQNRPESNFCSMRFRSVQERKNPSERLKEFTFYLKPEKENSDVLYLIIMNWLYHYYISFSKLCVRFKQQFNTEICDSNESESDAFESLYGPEW